MRWAFVKISAAFGILAMTSACASIIEGTSQDLTVGSTPQGADCDLMRQGQVIASLTTPGSVNIEKTKHDITVVCRKEGYEDSQAVISSDVAAATAGNILLGGLIGWGVDSAVGADNKYQKTTIITLVKK